MPKQGITRLCDRCQAEITRADEERGQCPICQAPLLSLAAEGPSDAGGRYKVTAVRTIHDPEERARRWRQVWDVIERQEPKGEGRQMERTEPIKAGNHFLVEPTMVDTEPCIIVTSPYDDEQNLLIPLAEARVLIDVLSQAAADLAAELGSGKDDDQDPGFSTYHEPETW